MLRGLRKRSAFAVRNCGAITDGPNARKSRYTHVAVCNDGSALVLRQRCFGNERTGTYAGAPNDRACFDAPAACEFEPVVVGRFDAVSQQDFDAALLQRRLRV